MKKLIKFGLISARILRAGLNCLVHLIPAVLFCALIILIAFAVLSRAIFGLTKLFH